MVAHLVAAGDVISKFDLSQCRFMPETVRTHTSYNMQAQRRRDSNWVARSAWERRATDGLRLGATLHAAQSSRPYPPSRHRRRPTFVYKAHTPRSDAIAAPHCHFLRRGHHSFTHLYLVTRGCQPWTFNIVLCPAAVRAIWLHWTVHCQSNRYTVGLSVGTILLHSSTSVSELLILIFGTSDGTTFETLARQGMHTT